MDGPPGDAADERGGAFGARLRRAREAAGLSQEELAERAGLSPNTVGGLERGENRHPYPATVRALAVALGLGDAERAALVSAVPTRRRPASEDIAAPPGLQLGPFAAALLVFVIWAFLVGALFAWLFNRMHAGDRSVNPK